MTPAEALDYAEAYMLRGERPRVDLEEVVRVLRARDAELSETLAKREVEAGEMFYEIADLKSQLNELRPVGAPLSAAQTKCPHGLYVPGCSECSLGLDFSAQCPNENPRTQPSTPQEAEVTREHRERAAAALTPGATDLERDWIEYGDSGVGYIPIIMARIAQAIADAEARGRASRDAELERARGELLDELESAMVDHYKGGCGEGLAFRCALGDMRTKYTQPTQPSLETE